MQNRLKIFLRYIYAYKFRGFYLYIKVYWLRRQKINLRNYGNLYIRRGTYDADVFTQVFIYRQYDIAIEGEVKIILDLGANNGLSAIYFHKKYPKAIIYALEPDGENFEILVANTEKYDQIIPINKAIWKEDGTVTLDNGDSWAIRVDTIAGKKTAGAITISSLIKEYKILEIDILKVDIEGAEKEVFEANISFLTKTKNIVIELHDWMKPGCARSFFRALNNFSYKYSIQRENTFIEKLQLVNTDD